MKTKSVKLILETTLSTDDKYCDGCPALGERWCNHLNESLASQELTGKEDRLICTRSQRCPFNPAKCYVCKSILEPKQIGDEYVIEHQCEGYFTTNITARGETAEDAVKNFEHYILYIGRAFRQR